MECQTCSDRITGREWQVCESCGQKFRQYTVPREDQDEFLKRLGLLVILMGVAFFVTLMVAQHG